MLGDSLAAANGQKADPLGDFISQNQGAWDQRYSNYQQMVGAFSQATGGTGQPGTQYANASGVLRTGLPRPAAQASQGCGGLGQVIVAVVAVVATVFTAGVASVAMGALQGGIGAALSGAGGFTGIMAAGGTALASGSIGAAVIGSAVGSIVSQGVGIAIGAQDSFSWKQVALSAVSGGVAGGLGGVNFTGATALEGGAGTLGNQIIQRAVGNALTQGVAVATGLQSSFSWRSVAASAAGAGVGAAVAPAIGNALGGAFGNNAGSAFASRLATGLVAGTAAAVMRGGKVAVQQVATDAFGNALGESLAGAMGQSSGSVGGGDSLEAFLALNDNFSGVSATRTFAEDRAMRSAALNPRGLPTSGSYELGSVGVGSAPSGPRTYTVQRGDNPATIGRAFFGDERAGAAIMAASGLDTSVRGARSLQVGQVLTIPDDISDSNLSAGGRLIGADSALRSQEAAAARAAQTASAAQSATSRNENYGNEGRSRPAYAASAYDDMRWLAQRGNSFAASASAPNLDGIYDEYGLMTNPAAAPIARAIAQPIANATIATFEGMREFKHGALSQIDVEASIAVRNGDDTALRSAALRHTFLDLMLPGSPQEVAIGVAGGAAFNKALGAGVTALNTLPILGDTLPQLGSRAVGWATETVGPAINDAAFGLLQRQGLILNAFDPAATKFAPETFSVLTSAPIAGTTRGAHRASANAEFANVLRTDPEYAAAVNREFGTDVLAHMESGVGGLRNPPGTEWHHPKTDPYSMWLLQREVHRAPSLQNYLHSGNSGGFADYYGR